MPNNEDEIFIVAFNVLHSTDAGKTQTSIAECTVPMLPYKTDRPTPHCDNHFAAVLLVAEQKAAKWEMPKLWLLAGIAPKYLLGRVGMHDRVATLPPPF